MGPESAKRVPGQQLVAIPGPPAPALAAGTDEAEAAAVLPRPAARPAGRASPEIADGRRGKGSVVGAFKPADGEALTVPSAGRTTANEVAFRTRVEAWMPPDRERIDAVMDHLRAHRAADVLWCSPAHPRWECVFQPTSAPSLNLMEPWGKYGARGP
jgi:hypothetical protein